jgi:hypothetical protein
MILERVICSPHFQRLTTRQVGIEKNSAIAQQLSLSLRCFRGTGRRLFSTETRRLNEGSRVEHPADHHGPPMPPPAWTTPNLKAANAPKKNSISNGESQLYGEKPRVSVLMELQDRLGVLHDVLKYFWKYDINVSRIESRPVKSGPWGSPKFDFYMDFEGSLGDPAVQRLMEDLGPLTQKLMVLDEKDVHWFPRHISDLDLIAHRTLDAGTDLESDHPGFNDAIYRERRATLTTNALNHRWDQPIPKIDYTPDETAVWTAVWDRMDGLWKKYACKEYLVRQEASSVCMYFYLLGGGGGG